MYLTWLDSNSWLIEIADRRLLIDPWLVGPLVFGNFTWLFKGERRSPRSIPENIDGIILSQGLEDHAHPPTLAKLDKNIPVIGSPNAAQVAQKLGFINITPLNHGETHNLGEGLEIKAVPGSPIGPTTIENGYILRDLTNQQSIYYEPHGYHSPTLQELGPVDVVITPTIDLVLPLIGPFIKGMASAVQVAKWLKPQVILPTAAGGDIEFSGLLLSILKAEGDAEQLTALLRENQLNTEVVSPTPWERFELNLQGLATH